VNHKYQGKIEELLGINIYNEKVVVVPNAVDSFWLNGSTPSDVPQDDIVRILSVGKVDKNKNHRLLIKAIQLLNNTNNRMRFELTIIGDYKAPFGQQLKSQYACDSVNFVGKKNKEEIKLLMAKSDIFALVSFRETFGIVYAEALSQNLPIIYTKGQGFDGWTDNTEIAIGVDSQDIQELLTALQKFGKRSKSKQQGARLVNQVFNWDIVASKILSEYAKSSVNFSNTLPTNR
jgi:glycosyltransferase involved in cell wall biosynthesis